MARYRLRFLLQEIDLHEGETLIGRSTECHVTIEDPLVSRDHARIFIGKDRLTIEDLGSRNGTYVNGKVLARPRALEDGDRLRIGTLELVFCRAPERVQPHPPGNRTTGFMCHCASCSAPYPAEAKECPRCGSNHRIDDDTISGVISEPERNWTLELLVEVLSKAVAVQRWVDVARVLTRARAHIEGRLAANQLVEQNQLEQVARAAVELATHEGNPEWADWVLSIHAAMRLVPAEAVLQPLDLMPDKARQDLAGPAARLLDVVEGGRGARPNDAASLVRVRALRVGR